MLIKFTKEIIKFQSFNKCKLQKKALFESKRTRAILVIGIVAIAIGLISKKVISFQTSGCTKRGQEFTFNKEKINPPYIKNLLT
tara:strand:+ start:194 stop:445 length:252 start_codon:yes stop_codon:yes gene_type:complete